MQRQGTRDIPQQPNNGKELSSEPTEIKLSVQQISKSEKIALEPNGEKKERMKNKHKEMIFDSVETSPAEFPL